MAEKSAERWEALAEAHFSFDGDITDDNYISCLCSRVFIRNGVKLYTAEAGGSESEGEGAAEHSHVHFSQDTADREKYEKEDVASCYCSASHTDNNYSTDEHDTNAPKTRLLQLSDSGADLTYHDFSHNASTPADDQRLILNDISMDEDSTANEQAKSDTTNLENYLSHNTWEKYWQENGERLIWASWINQYSDYMNPSYLDEASLPKEQSYDRTSLFQNEEKVEVRERKFSYDSKVNPYSNQIQKTSSGLGVGDDWCPVARQRSCSEHDRIVSPRALTTSDSMTNVTKITLSSCDVNSSHVTSESPRSDDYSVSSSSSNDQSNDQTRVDAADGDNSLVPNEEVDADQYWQFQWKKHFGEQYALHYANYIETHSAQENTLPSIVVENEINEQETNSQVNSQNNSEELNITADIECENSDGNSQELPSVIEVQEQVKKIKLHDEKPRKRNKNNSNYISSVGVLLQTLLNEKKHENEELMDADGEQNVSEERKDVPSGSVVNTARGVDSSGSNVSPDRRPDGDGEDEPPEKKPIALKRSHESDNEEVATEKIRSTFNQIGLSWETGPTVRGELVYSKKMYQLRPPRSKRQHVAKKTYFDDEGRPYTVESMANERNDDTKEMQTDDDFAQVKSDDEPCNEMTQEFEPRLATTEAPEASTEPVAKKVETDTGLSDVTDSMGTDTVKRKRRKHKKSFNTWSIQLPAELSDEPVLIKYWHKRHSLFHRFDEGIRLDRESWFSVTPENVAKHLAERCRCDLIVDAFCGAGGNAIQFAWTCERVIAIDIDPHKIALARHNAAVYGLSDRIEFLVGDFFQLAPALKADVVFLSPPWGGPQYSKERSYDLETMLEPRPASHLMSSAQAVSSNIALYVPRTSRSDQLVELAKSTGAVEIEQNFLGRRLVAVTAYYGDLVNY